MCVCMCVCVCVYVCVHMYVQAKTCVMSHQSLSRQVKPKSESPTAVEFGSRSSKSDHGRSCSD